MNTQHTTNAKAAVCISFNYCPPKQFATNAFLQKEISQKESNDKKKLSGKAKNAVLSP